MGEERVGEEMCYVRSECMNIEQDTQAYVTIWDGHNEEQDLVSFGVMSLSVGSLVRGQ